MYLLFCVLKIHVLLQASITTKKNRILSVIFQRISEMNDDFLKQISLLAPFLEQNILHLDAPSTALMLLHSAILLNPELEGSSNEEQRRLLSAIIAALRQQTLVVYSLLTEASSVDFSCYETQCAASTLMALETYLQSGKDLSLVFRCITEPILELLQERNPTKVNGDKKMTKQKKTQKHLQKSVKIMLKKGLLCRYVTDGIGIANVLCGENSRHIGYPEYRVGTALCVTTIHSSIHYYHESRIDERLVLLRSPIADLVQNSYATSRQQKPNTVLQPVVILRLKKQEARESSLKWQTAIDLLLFLLRVDLFFGEERTVRRSALKYLRQILYVYVISRFSPAFF